MSHTRMLALFVTAALSLGWVSLAVAQVPRNPLGKTPTLGTPPADQVRDDVLAWLAAQDPDDDVLADARAIWNPAGLEANGQELLHRLALTVALVDDRARELVEICSQPRRSVIPPPQDWLFDEALDPLVRNNLRLLYGRWLSQEHLYDESLLYLSDVAPEEVVDPASLLFFQGVAYHRLLDKQAGLDTLDRLLDDVVDAPQRYASLAGLMRVDLQGVEEDSLDHIARRMDDIRRRLQLGHAGEKVIEIEDGVIASLDKLIEELEEQQQQQQQSASSSGGSGRSSSPAPDSRILGGGGAGEVDRRPIGSESGWGALPPKQREEALQQIGKEFPSHYRDVIEQYFRKLAAEGRQQPGE